MINVIGYKRVKNKNTSRFSLQCIFKCLEDPDYPSTGPFLRVMNLTGYWNPNKKLISTRFKQVVYYITVSFFFSVYIKCLMSFDPSSLIFALQTAPFHMGVAKAIFFRNQYSKWEKIIDFMSRTERRQLSDKEEEVFDIMDDYIKKSRKVLYLYWIMVICCNVSIFTEPYQKIQIVENSTNIYVPLFDFYVPFKQDTPPGYYYSMALQTILGNVASSYVVSWDSLVISTFIFFAGQLRISRVYCCNAIDPDSKERSHRNIIKCFRFQMSLVEHQKLFEQLISTVMFLYLMVVSINLGICIIETSKSAGNLTVLMSAASYVFAIFIQLLMFYWFSNEVTEQSLCVSSGVFESEWITMDAKIRKEVSILQLATSKRLVFRAGPCNEISLTTFVAILKTSYSFFALLKETN